MYLTKIVLSIGLKVIEESGEDESGLDNLHRGLKLIRVMAEEDREKRQGLLRIRYENESLDVLRAYYHFFLKHTKTKTEMKKVIGKEKLGKTFTIYDEGLAILLMMNNWTTWEMLAKGEKTAKEIGNKYRLYTKADDGMEDESIAGGEKKRKVQYRGWSKEGISMYNSIIKRLDKMKHKKEPFERQDYLENELMEELQEEYGDRKRKNALSNEDSDSDDSEIRWDEEHVAFSGFDDCSPNGRKIHGRNYNSDGEESDDEEKSENGGDNSNDGNLETIVRLQNNRFDMMMG